MLFEFIFESIKVVLLPLNPMKNQISLHKIYFIIYLLFIAFSSYFLWNNSKEEIHLFLNQFHAKPADFFFKYFTDLGDGIAIMVVILFLLFISKRMSIQVAAAGFLSGLIAQVLKKGIFSTSPRPSAYFREADISLYYVPGEEMHTVFSFPSGHATIFFTLATSILLIQKTKRYDLLLIAFAILGAYSRVYLSQHFLEDIFTGSIIGILSSLLVYRLLHSHRMLLKKQLDKPLIKMPIN